MFNNKSLQGHDFLFLFTLVFLEQLDNFIPSDEIPLNGGAAEKFTNT